MGKKITIIILVLLIIYNLGYMYYYNDIDSQVSCTISPESDYIDYDPMDNPSDSLARILQEMKCS